MIIQIMALAVFSPFLQLQQNDWHLAKQKDGITVYTKAVDQSGLKSTKVVSLFEISRKRFLKEIINVELHDELIDNCQNVALIKNSGDSLIVFYEQFDLPWPAGDRDVVVQMKVKANTKPNESEVESLALSNVFEPKKSFIRIKNFKANWKIIELSPNKIYVEYIATLHPEGTVPLWVVNLFLADVPHNSFKKLKKHLDLK